MKRILLFLTLLLSMTALFAQTTDTIVDNNSPLNEYLGTWYVSSATDCYGEDSLWSRDGNTFTFNIDIASTGDYEIYMHWSSWDSRSSEVPCTIQTDSGSINKTTIIDQSINGGQWNSLGIEQLTAGDILSITLTAAPAPSSTCADAVKISQIANYSLTASITFSWDTNPPSENVTHYTIYNIITGTKEKIKEIQENTVTLSLGKGDYEIAVSASNQIGESELSEETIRFRIIEGTNPSSPTNLQTESVYTDPDSGITVEFY